MYDNRKVEDAVLALMSVVLTDEGVRLAEELFNTLFALEVDEPQE